MHFPPKNKHQTIIIGAGPAGLTAAYELHKRGRPALILEASDTVGGISQTVNYRGFRFDIGGHRFFSKSEYVNYIWREILGDDFIERPRLSRIYYRGHFFDYPLKAFNALSGLGATEAVRVMLSYLKSQLFPNQPEATFEDWVSNRFGKRLYRIFFKTYTEKVWGIPCGEISADWAAQRIKNLSLKEALRNALFSAGKTENGEIITTLIEKFHYPRLGPGMMWERCEQQLCDNGVPTLHDHFVTTVEHEANRVHTVRTRNSRNETFSFSGDSFISSMPLRELIFSLSPKPPQPVLDAAQRLRYRDYLTVVLIVDRADIFPDNWIYIHSPDVKLGRIQNYKNWSPEMVPDTRQTALGLEYFLWEKDDEWRWPEQQLIDLGIRECAKLGLINPDEVVDGTVVRMKKAYPVYDQHYHDSLATIQNYLATFENLQTIGRNGLHRYNNQDHSMLTGVFAARNICGETYDVWAVNVEKEYHEDGEHESTATGERLTPKRLEPAGRTEHSFDEVIDEFFARLDPVALGVAVGIVCGSGLFLLTVLTVLNGHSQIAPKLSLLGNYFWGFETSWIGAIVGLCEASIGGFLFGNAIAKLRNWAASTFAGFLRNRTELQENRDILDKFQ